MNKKVLNIFFRFYMEWTFATLIILMLHILSRQQMPLLSTMAIPGIASLLFAILLERKRNQAKALYFLLIMPALYLTGLWVGIPIFYISIMALFIFWRTLNYHQDVTSNSESVWLVLTFLIGLFLSPLAHFYDGAYLRQIAFLLAFQLMFIIAGQFFIKWLDIELVSKRKFAGDFSKLLGLGLLILLILTFGRNFIKSIFFFILQGIGWIFSILLYPLFAWVENPILKERAGRLLSSRQPPAKEYESPFANAKELINPDLWGPILFSAIGVLIFFYLYKKTSLFTKEQEVGVSPSGYVTSSSLDDSMYSDPFYKNRTGMPVNQIRKEIYHLEKYAQKKDLARLNHEAINEWLQRLGIDYDERTVQTYQQVRYGASAENEVEEWFKEEIKRIKKQLTILEKERKDTSKSGIKSSLKKVFKR
ncbi:hypothetical protein AABM38_07720 [Heyndrickxia sp. MSNUG]|uniref:hypothetical protein n=1 Tax=Heyndrickxia sp. MSNUG TaxID=3136677 RepID=UPI003C2B0835